MWGKYIGILKILISASQVPAPTAPPQPPKPTTGSMQAKHASRLLIYEEKNCSGNDVGDKALGTSKIFTKEYFLICCQE